MNNSLPISDPRAQQFNQHGHGGHQGHSHGAGHQGHDHSSHSSHGHGHGHGEGGDAGGHSHSRFQFKGPKRVFTYQYFLSGDFFFQFLEMIPFFYTFYGLYNGLFMYAMQGPMGLTDMVNTQISGIPPIIKQLLGGFFIPYLLVVYWTYSHVNQYLIPHLAFPNDIELTLKILFLVYLFLTFLLFFVDPGFYNTDEDREELKILMAGRPELTNKINCQACMVPKIARSQHCMFCQACVARWDGHSQIFNRCIGAGNIFYYIIYNMVLGFLFFNTFSCFLRNQKDTYTGGFTSKFFLLFSLHQCVTSFKWFFLYLNTMKAWSRLPYMWKNKNREFFNPFDQPIISGQSNQKKERNNMRSQQQIQRGETVDSVIPITPQFDNDLKREEVINWLTKRYILVMDIPNSPMRAIAQEEIQKQERMQKAMMQSYQEQMAQFKTMMEQMQRQQGLSAGNFDPNAIPQHMQRQILMQMAMAGQQFEQQQQIPGQHVHGGVPPNIHGVPNAQPFNNFHNQQHQQPFPQNPNQVQGFPGQNPMMFQNFRPNPFFQNQGPPQNFIPPNFQPHQHGPGCNHAHSAPQVSNESGEEEKFNNNRTTEFDLLNSNNQNKSANTTYTDLLGDSQAGDNSSANLKNEQSNIQPENQSLLDQSE